MGWGHDELEWKRIVSSLRLIGYDYVLSIEHEDAMMSTDDGIASAVTFPSAGCVDGAADRRLVDLRGWNPVRDQAVVQVTRPDDSGFIRWFRKCERCAATVNSVSCSSSKALTHRIGFYRKRTGTGGWTPRRTVRVARWQTLAHTGAIWRNLLPGSRITSLCADLQTFYKTRRKAKEYRTDI